MGRYFVATLGQRPEALTMAFNALRRKHDFDGFVVLHTEPSASGIARAYADLMRVLRDDYPGLGVFTRETAYPDGRPLLDLDSEAACNAYFHAVYDALYELKQNGHSVHLMISGGRKAMSAFATAAAALCFDSHDRVWTVLADERLVAREGVFHAPPGTHDMVQLVALPLVTARHAYTMVADEALRRAKESPRDKFLHKLTDAERDVAEALRDKPQASDAELARLLSKAPKTVENQLRAIYNKMVGFLEGAERLPDRSKRTTLILLLTQE